MFLALFTATLNNQRNLKILAPSESLNGLTIGALYDDFTNTSETDRSIWAVLGLFNKFIPKHNKVYRNIGKEIEEGIGEYIADVKSGVFPAESNTFGGVTEEDLKDL